MVLLALRHPLRGTRPLLFGQRAGLRTLVNPGTPRPGLVGYKVRPLGITRPLGARFESTAEDNDGHHKTDAHVPGEYDHGGVSQLERAHASVYISNVFPIRLGSWDIRPAIARMWENSLMEELVEVVSNLKGRHAFRVESWEVASKDGGVFCHFSYLPPNPEDLPRRAPEAEFHTPEDIAPDPTSPAALFLPLFVEAAHKHGGWPSWIGPWWSSVVDGMRFHRSTQSNESGHILFSGDLKPSKNAATVPELRGWQCTAGAGRVWMVRGRQWTEDMNRFPSSRLRVEFNGPDVSQEVLYTLFRPYGRLMDIQPPQPVPAGALRFATLNYSRISPAVNANNCLHGFSTPTNTAEYDQKRTDENANVPLTRLRLYFERPLKAHYIRDWISSHPRIALPVFAFLIGTFSYTFFDPIRELFVKLQIEGMWHLEKYSAFRFVRDSVYRPITDALYGSRGRNSRRSLTDLGRASFRDRVEAENSVERWLSEFPSTFVVVTGPPGSGKHDLVDLVLKQEDKPSLVMDCFELAKAKSDGALISSLAHETGYWPVFSFLQSISGLIDLASVGLIGQKAGFSTPVDEQMRTMLDTVTSALKDVTKNAKENRVKEQQHKLDKLEMAAYREHERQMIERGLWHDGRLDCVAGNGVMSELGMGLEDFGEDDMDAVAPIMASTAPIDGEGVPPAGTAIGGFDKMAEAAAAEGETPADDVDSEAEQIKTLPIVVLRNYACRTGRGDLWKVLAEWGASLIENRIAHVIVVGEGSVTHKTLTAALPSKPLNSVNLSDADDHNALEFVREKLSTEGHPYELDARDKTDITKLGGRMVDLELLVYKVKGSGQSIHMAVDDIVRRNTVEIRKAAFGDDSSESKSLPWTPEQAWKIVKELAAKNELSYAKTITEFPFKGFDTNLKAMEEHGLICLTTSEGRPTRIKPGKPVFHEAFRALVDDPVFHALCQMQYNAAISKKAEADIATFETELQKLKAITEDGDHLNVAQSSWLGKGSPIQQRAQYLVDELGKRMDKIRASDADSAEQLKFVVDPSRK